MINHFNMKTKFYNLNQKLNKIDQFTSKAVLIIFLFIGISTQVDAQNYNVTLPQQCSPTTGGSETLIFPNTPLGAVTSGTLEIEVFGDLDLSNEYLEFFDESNNLLGQTNAQSQCTGIATYIFTLPAISLNSWAATGNNIQVTVAASSGVNVLAACNNSSFCVTKATLSYTAVSGPNDVGVVSIDSPSNFCAGVQNIKATIQNFGTNQVTGLTVNWSINGVNQTPINYPSLLDTFGGSGNNQVQLLLGTHNFLANQSYNIKAWTSNPNNVQDTTNLNDTISDNFGAAIAGNLTVGGPGANYATLNDVINVLNNYGLCGSVIINLRPGIYTEQVSFGQIEGLSSTNTITIQAENGDSSSVTIKYNATSAADNYIFNFNDASYITIKNLTLEATGSTYGKVLLITGGSHNLTFKNNRIIGNLTTTSTSTNLALIHDESGSNEDYLKFHNNLLLGGSHGIYLYGASTTSKEIGNEIYNNIIYTNYRGLYIYNQENIEAIGNYIDNSKYYVYTSYYGIYAYYIDGSSKITRNNIVMADGIYGIYFGTSDGISASNPNIIGNNFISIDGSGTISGLYLAGTSTFLSVVHNSIHIIASSTTSRAIYTGASGNNINIINNIFVNTGGGYAAYFSTTSSLNIVNHNDYYAPSSQYLAYWGGNRAFLVDLRVASGKNLNSVSVNPYFKSEIDLHAALTVNNLGMALSYINDDIDGDSRSATSPDLGADEFTPSPIDITTLQLLSPGEYCGLTSSETVSMRFINFGLNTISAGQSIQVHYKVDNNPTVTETLTLSGNLITLASTTYTFNTPVDLKDSNTYSVKVWTTIIGDGNAENDTLVTIIENPLVQKFTWIEDFESMTVGTSGEYPRGWNTPEGTAYSWIVGEGQTPSTNTGPFHDYNPKTFTGNYLYMETNNGSSGSAFLIESPCLEINNLTTPGINFAYHMYGATVGELHLDVMAADSTYLSVWSMTGDQGDQWYPVALDLGQFSNYDVIQLRFRGIRGSGATGDIAIDDIRVGNIPRINFPSTINDCGFVRLDAGNPGSSYDWSTGETSQMIEIIAGPLPVTKYVTLQITSPNGMRNYTEMDVVLQPGPYVFLGNDTVLCDLPSYTLDAGNPNATFEWDNGLVTQTRTISTSGTYTVEVSELGCTKADTIDVIMDVSPVAAFTYIDNPNNSVTVFNSSGSVGNTYTWLFGDGNGSNVANPTHQYTGSADSILVTLIVSNFCGSDTLRQVVVNVNTGIEDLSIISGAEIYPNPSSGLFNIDITTAKVTDIEISVFNMQGQLVKSIQYEQVSKLSEELDLNGKAKGVYYLKIKAGDEMTVRKIVTQ